MRAWVLGIIILGAAQSAQAGDITRPDSQSSFQWTSTDCVKPIPKSASSGLSKQDRLLAYARDIELYINCIQTEAQRDFQIAQEEMQAAIERDLEAKTQTMNDMMLEAAKQLR